MSAPYKTYYFEDLTVGQRETLMKTVMDDDVIAFADLSGDRNPVHLSDHFARKTRFGERIVHGLYTASLISTVIGMYLPGPGAVYLSQTLNFRGPVKIGDVITVVVEVQELVEKGRRVTLHCECLVDGKVVLDGQALVMAPSKAPTPRPAATA
ncbi:MAG: MaoC family dehydratase [Beijerinckiaceae bacterium]